MLSGTAYTVCCDPTQPMQAADKHYVDEQSALAVPLTGATMTGHDERGIRGFYQVDQFGIGFWSEVERVSEWAEPDEWRNMRRAQLLGNAGHGIEPDDFNG